ncbi:MAG: hypothetical protein A3G38_01755 [Omnitrophica WOR_2 bacterium RIFCSPLOWO2_12_FULL_51_8]|nr:MAG: hypothetical protein A3G38_01755 [Omnitrophica WOR_2 bacterium RIFCSPLOWO2_12_FULL_51_8]
MAKKEKTAAGKGIAFICQVNDLGAKIIKCRQGGKNKFSVLQAEIIPPEADEIRLQQKLAEVISGMGYSDNPLIVSIPRNQATSKYLKVPAAAAEEIEKIVGLQAARYLPYPANELITGFQVLSSDKEGFTYINLVIAHRDAISRYVKIAEALKAKRLNVFLSSYGLCSLYNSLFPRAAAPVILADIDVDRVELAIAKQEVLLFSRSFKFDPSSPNWQGVFTEELNRTRDAYLKDVAKEPPQKIVILKTHKDARGLTEALSGGTDLPVEELDLSARIDAAAGAREKIFSSGISFHSLIGMGLAPVSEYLNLLPKELKEEAKVSLQRKSQARLIFSLSAIILIAGLAAARNLDNKARYLEWIKTELNKISGEARPLEEIEKRFQALEDYGKKRLSGLDVLYELYKNIPERITLLNFSYEEDGKILIHGVSPELNLVPEFIARLEKSPVFGKFEIKIKYASKKRTPAGEVMDFEIACGRGS